MPVYVRCLLGCLLMVWVGSGPALAQEDAARDTSQLPEIAPREFEIRGERQIDFPELERPSLSGFRASPSLPTVPVDRAPYTPSYIQPLDSLPGRLPAPQGFSGSAERPPPPGTGRLETGTGRYFSRFVEGSISTPLSETEHLGIHVDYDGTEGETPFDDLEAESSSDAADGTVRFTSRRDPVRVEATLDGVVEDYSLFGVPRAQIVPTSSAPDRTLTSGGASVQVQTVGSIASTVGLSYTRTASETAPAEASDFTFRQGRVALDGSLDIPVGPVEGTLEAHFAHTRLRADVPDDSETEVDVGARALLIDRPDLTVEGGLRVLRTEGPVVPEASASPDESTTWVAPEANAEWRLTSWATAFARNTPHLKGGGLLSLHRQNPYAERAPSTRPTLFLADTETGLDLSAGWLRFETRAGFRYAPSYRFFETRPGAGLSSVRHEDARIFHGGAQVALQGVEGVQASLGVTARDGELTDLDTDIPHFANVTADAMAAVSFLDDRAYLQVTGTLEGPRDVNTDTADEVDTFLAVDVTGSYSVTSLVDIVVRAENIGSDTLERWPNFPRPSNSISAGFRIRW